MCVAFSLSSQKCDIYSIYIYLVCLFIEISLNFDLLWSKPKIGHLSLFIHSKELCLPSNAGLLRLFRCVRSSTPRAPPSPQLLGFQSTQLPPWIHWTVFFTPVNQMLCSPRQCLQQEQAITVWRYRFTSYDR